MAHQLIHFIKINIFKPVAAGDMNNWWLQLSLLDSHQSSNSTIVVISRFYSLSE